jgi:hypothetical protein
MLAGLVALWLCGSLPPQRWNSGVLVTVPRRHVRTVRLDWYATRPDVPASYSAAREAL